ncbi:HAD-IA family hydrolase [Antarctobacter heliothermus]|uniref:Phosphoglycolate phosphatase n=1 Tax=Antarctobacter heliothermus TaxID=74033 RepID=A0A239CA36_9RHOB|nr:HAD-IA family hydrolase [Antarctobacter heliothermus]SNS17095.1 phosphoglycolate phosphatase [Antarctobacter heliothermus]
MTLRLVIFDVDGTLVDSQGDILGAMSAAYASEGMERPSREAILSIVGLSLPQAFSVLAPDLGAVQRTRLVEGYKDAYAGLRMTGGPEASPLYPGIPALLDRLSARDDVLLGIATGKSRRGLTALLESQGLTQLFVTRQCADGNPSKPHPAMLYTAIEEAGVEAEHAMMIGDTSYDMEMARAAGIARIGVTWGYHPREALVDAQHVVDDAAALERAIGNILGEMS